MRYLAAFPVLLLFAILDVVCIITIFGLILIYDDGLYTWRFAKGVWEI